MKRQQQETIVSEVDPSNNWHSLKTYAQRRILLPSHQNSCILELRYNFHVHNQVNKGKCHRALLPSQYRKHSNLEPCIPRLNMFLRDGHKWAEGRDLIHLLNQDLQAPSILFDKMFLPWRYKCIYLCAERKKKQFQFFSGLFQIFHILYQSH